MLEPAKDRLAAENRQGIEDRGADGAPADGDSQGLGDLAEVAAHRALAAAGLDVTDIDMLILATITPETTCPSNACFLQARIGAVNAAAFESAVDEIASASQRLLGSIAAASSSRQTAPT